MSPNELATTHLIPKSSRAHGACSREDPQPKFGPLHTNVFACLYGSLFRTKLEFSCPVFGSYRHAWKRALPSPDRLIVLRNCFGMIASVSTFAISIGAAMPFSTVNFGIPTWAAVAGADEFGAEEVSCWSSG